MACTQLTQRSAGAVTRTGLTARHRAGRCFAAGQGKAVAQAAWSNSMHSSAAAPATLQQLYEAGKAAFGGGRAAGAAQVLRLKELLAAVPLSELGVQPVDDPPLEVEQGAPQQSFFSRAFNFKSNGARRRQRRVIEYLHVHEDADLSMGIFRLQRGACLPLHNHPGMTVLSRVLYGDMHVRAFDWAEPAPGGDPWAPRRATLVADRVIHAGEEPAVLQAASGGNLHAFTAASSCAVLDLLAPPYDTRNPDRDCTYYRELPDSGGQPGSVLLQAHDPVDQDEIVRGSYRGVRVAPQRQAAQSYV